MSRRAEIPLRSYEALNYNLLFRWFVGLNMRLQTRSGIRRRLRRTGTGYWPVERGLDVSQGLLVIVDGGKGLRAAVRQAFRHRALVQRVSGTSARTW